MKEMGWSWEDLETTPVYIKTFCYDFLGLMNAAQQQAYEKSNA